MGALRRFADRQTLALDRPRFLPLMLRFVLSAAVAAVLLMPGTGAAQPKEKPMAVLELFTSQGCSSCPPADAYFEQLAQDPSVVVLTYPVTYWDYLGWKDTLGQDMFTKRQKLYAKARGDGQVYTPQAVVSGGVHCVGSDRADIAKHAGAQTLPARVTLAEADGRVVIRIGAAQLAGEVPMASVWLVPITMRATVPIARGENRGRTVTYANVVRDMVRVGSWNGEASELSVSLASAKPEGADGYVVLVQAERASKHGALPSTILGAAQSGR